jgi:hypothetical protein
MVLRVTAWISFLSSSITYNKHMDSITYRYSIKNIIYLDFDVSSNHLVDHSVLLDS